jgi:hypothetical protein
MCQVRTCICGVCPELVVSVGGRRRWRTVHRCGDDSLAIDRASSQTNRAKRNWTWAAWTKKTQVAAPHHLKPLTRLESATCSGASADHIFLPSELKKEEVENNVTSVLSPWNWGKKIEWNVGLQSVVFVTSEWFMTMKICDRLDTAFSESTECCMTSL